MASMFFPFRILVCFFVHFPLRSFGFICPGPVNPPHGISYARIEPNISGRADEVYEKIRIKLSYDASIEGKPHQALVQEAEDFWTNVLSVKPVDGRLFKSRDCDSNDKPYLKISSVSGKRAKFCLGSCSNTTKCDEIMIPKEHLDGCHTCTQDGPPCDENEPEPGAGIDNADLVFYVASINSETCRSGLVVAYSGYCDLEPVLDRPVFVLINICPITKASNSNDMKAMLWTIKHEMMHALGFNALLFARFRDKEGNPLWPRDQDGEPIGNEAAGAKQKVVNYTDREWHVRGGSIIVKHALLVTPSVVREAQSHFGCLDLEGAELEDYGNFGSKLGHFEARVFYDDAMRADTAGKGLFSRLDFAVLEDSGWYQVNYSQAEEMDFGRNLGCDFCMKSCKFWMDQKRREGKSVHPYCNTPDLTFAEGVTCVGPKKLFSGCPLAIHGPEFIRTMHDPNSRESFTELPRKYQHFDEISGLDKPLVPLCGSRDPFAELCPVPVQNYDVTEMLGNAYQCSNDTNPSLKQVEPNPSIVSNLTSSNPITSSNPNTSSNPTTSPNPTTSSNLTREPIEPNPTASYPAREPLEANLTSNSWDSTPAREPLEPNLTSNSWDSTPAKEPLEPNLTSNSWDSTRTSTSNPEKEAKLEEDETNKSSHFGSSILLGFLFPLMVAML